MGEDVQIRTQWLPSPLQARFLTTAIESEGKPSITALCEEAGVGRQTFYDWLHNDLGFKEKWEGLWTELLAGTFSTVMKSLVARAQGGDVPAIRLVSELRGLIKQKSEVSGPNGAPIQTQTLNVNLDLSFLPEEEVRQYRELLAKLHERAVRLSADSGPGACSA